VLDGELIVAVGDRLDFDRLQDRIHPADSRVRMLAEATPAAYVAFDLLAVDDESLMDAPLAVRAGRLEDALRPAAGSAGSRIHLTPMTTEPEVARRWFEQFEGAGLDGVVAKPLDGVYQPDKRAMFKVKHERTADVVLAGYRLHKGSTEERPLLGSLLLGLYDAEGNLRHLGVSASFPTARRAQLYDELQPLACDPAEHPWGRWQEITASGERVPGAVSRWSAGKDLSFTPVRPDLVLEVGYDHMEGDRFRHTAQFKRWRPDRDPATCTYEQLEEPVSYDLADVLEAPKGPRH
jgi:ATP-dependent DNA ligase